MENIELEEKRKVKKEQLEKLLTLPESMELDAFEVYDLRRIGNILSFTKGTPYNPYITTIKKAYTTERKNTVKGLLKGDNLKDEPFRVITGEDAQLEAQNLAEAVEDCPEVTEIFVGNRLRIRDPENIEELEELNSKKAKDEEIRNNSDSHLDEKGVITFENEGKKDSIEGISVRQAIIALGEENLKEYFKTYKEIEEEKAKEKTKEEIIKEEELKNNYDTVTAIERKKEKGKLEKLIEKIKGLFKKKDEDQK